MRTALVACVLACSSPAFAERTTTVNLGGMFGGVEDLDDVDNYYEQPTMHPAGGPRVMLGWEHAPPALPAQPGLTGDVSLVPELVAGALLDDERGDAFVGVGVRGEVRLAQREMGLLRVSARFSLYLAARALVIGREQDSAAEFVLGEYIYLGRGRTRLGGEISVFVREAPMTFSESQMAVFASLYLGWAM